MNNDLKFLLSKITAITMKADKVYYHTLERRHKEEIDLYNKYFRDMFETDKHIKDKMIKKFNTSLYNATYVSTSHSIFKSSMNDCPPVNNDGADAVFMKLL